MIGKDGEARALADLGLVGLVVGGITFLVLGVVTLGIGALLGRIPLFLGVLLGFSMLVTVIGLVVTIATGQTRRSVVRSPTDREGRS